MILAEIIAEFDSVCFQRKFIQLQQFLSQHQNPEFRAYLLEYLSQTVSDPPWGWTAVMDAVFLPDAGEESLAFLRSVYDRRDDLNRLKDGHWVVQNVARRLRREGTQEDRLLIARSHSSRWIRVCFLAALCELEPAELYEEYVGYLTVDRADSDEVRADANRHAKGELLELLADLANDSPRRLYQYETQEEQETPPITICPPLDPRWLDALIDMELAEFDSGVTIRLPSAIKALLQPGHVHLNNYLVKRLHWLLENKRETEYVLQAMVDVEHPQIVEACLDGMKLFLQGWLAETNDQEVDPLYDPKEDRSLSEPYTAVITELAKKPGASEKIDRWIDQQSPQIRDFFRQHRKPGGFLKKVKFPPHPVPMASELYCNLTNAVSNEIQGMVTAGTIPTCAQGLYVIQCSLMYLYGNSVIICLKWSTEEEYQGRISGKKESDRRRYYRWYEFEGNDMIAREESRAITAEIIERYERDDTISDQWHSILSARCTDAIIRALKELQSRQVFGDEAPSRSLIWLAPEVSEEGANDERSLIVTTKALNSEDAASRFFEEYRSEKTFKTPLDQWIAERLGKKSGGESTKLLTKLLET